jgi:hypothetical protein
MKGRTAGEGWLTWRVIIDLMPIVLNGTFGSTGHCCGPEVDSVLRSLRPASGDREPTISGVRISYASWLKTDGW